MFSSTIIIVTQFLPADMSVNIRVHYEAPPDFGLLPPYYRPASHLELICTASGAVDYQWNRRYHPSCNYDDVCTKYFLTTLDSGTYTCTVTDSDGSVVSASVQVLLYGEPVAVAVKLYNFSLVVGVGLNAHGNSIANNTALSWDYGDWVVVHCYSNSTLDRAVIVTPNGRNYSDLKNDDRYTITRQSPSGILFEANGGATPGIYTCIMMGPNHQVRDMSFGIYDFIS